MLIGILAIQGDFEAHRRVLERLRVAHRLVRTTVELEGLDALILPGGESTTHLKFLRDEGLLGAIQTMAGRGGAFFGTCAGAILLARAVRNPAQPSLGLMDIEVLRNGYGRQLASDVRCIRTTLKEQALEMVFIRAPVIEKVGKEVKVLAEYEGQPVLVEQGRNLAATFHPELTSDTTVHEYFLKRVRNGT